MRGNIAAENTKRDRARADSDDTHGVSNGASVIAAPPAANTDHDRSAEAARDSSKGQSGSAASAKKRAPREKKSKETEEPREPVPPGLDVLPTDGPAFTEALNAQADLLEVGRRLLNSKDEPHHQGRVGTHAGAALRQRSAHGRKCAPHRDRYAAATPRRFTDAVANRLVGLDV